ncbi:hypothetical protein [Marinobacterium aestuarii]|uniref:hypothetical protein n=1 Tax=Marinobacterium aestuarii TaxID=1821621 RepID=UPI0012FF865D|nr:hypothetical protein [Marinobacterium aestuarii]
MSIRVLILYAIIGLLVTGCGGEQYSFQKFVYPEKYKPHESGWTYEITVTVSTRDRGSMLRKGNKNVLIELVDLNGEILLMDKYIFNSSGIKSIVAWESDKIFSISLIEYGRLEVDNEFSNKIYSKGERVIKIIRYSYNNKTGRFE